MNLAPNNLITPRLPDHAKFFLEASHAVFPNAEAFFSNPYQETDLHHQSSGLRLSQFCLSSLPPWHDPSPQIPSPDFHASHPNASGVARGFLRIESPPVFIHRLTPLSEVSKVALAIAGKRNLLLTEKIGGYPGGAKYLKKRQQILSRHLRPGCVGLAKAGNGEEAWSLYLETFWMHVRLRAWKFLIGLPMLLLQTFFHKKLQ